MSLILQVLLTPPSGAPFITIVAPPAGSTIAPNTPIVFRYNDDIGFRRPLPFVRFLQPDQVNFRYELIHDGDNFTTDYQGTLVIIQTSPPIWEYTVTRRGGWGAIISYHGGSPTLVPFGTDTGGNEPA